MPLLNISSRRGFIAGLVSALAAPAIVHAGNLMPVKLMLPCMERGYGFWLDGHWYYKTKQVFWRGREISFDLIPDEAISSIPLAGLEWHNARRNAAIEHINSLRRKLAN